MKKPGLIVDCHVNIFEERHLGPLYHQQAVISRRGRTPPAADAETLFEKLKGVDKAIIFGLKYRESTGVHVPDEITSQAVAKYPGKFVGFACINPTYPSAMDDLRHAVEGLKLKGVKMGPIYQNFHLADPRVQPVLAYCEKNNIPVTLHMGTTFVRDAALDFGRPIHVEGVALRFPQLKIIMAHMGHPWEGECIAVFRKQPNVYAEISALHYRPWQFYNTLVLAQEYQVCHKIFWGTDYPFAEVDESIEGLKEVNRFTEGTALPRVSQENIDQILYSNPLDHWWHA